MAHHLPAIELEQLGAGDPFLLECDPPVEVLRHLDQHLGRHAAYTRTGGAERPPVDQQEILCVAPHLGGCVEAGSASSDDRHIHVSGHVFSKHRATRPSTPARWTVRAAATKKVARWEPQTAETGACSGETSVTYTYSRVTALRCSAVTGIMPARYGSLPVAVEGTRTGSRGRLESDGHLA